MAQTKVDYSQNPSGQELLDDYLGKEQENILTTNSGVRRPVYAKAGTIWLDLSATPWKLKAFDGNSDIVLGYINATTHAFTAAGDDNFVHKTGAETIDGVKTFKKRIVVNENNEGLRIVNINYTEGTAPSVNAYASLVFNSVDGKYYVLFDNQIGADGSSYSRWIHKNAIKNKTVRVEESVSSSGESMISFTADRVRGVTPAASSNSNDFATTEWVIANMSVTKHLVVSTLPAVIDPDAFYYIPE